VSELSLVIGRIGRLFLAGLGIKKRSGWWGVVYDSMTKVPLDPARVILTSPEGVTIASAITDFEGRFHFRGIAPGNYMISVQKPGYHFPSEKLTGRDRDEVYESLYFGESFTVAPGGIVTLRNIPMDPEYPHTEVLMGKPSRLAEFHAGIDSSVAAFAGLATNIGLLAAALVLIATHAITAAIIFGMYCVLFLVRQNSLWAHPFGYVRDANTGEPVSYAVIRVSGVGTGEAVAERVTDLSGKYHVPLPSGRYMIRVDRRMPDGTYVAVVNGVEVPTSNRYIASDLAV
jgi:hypothetical protein